MMNFHSKIIGIEGREPYIKVFFEDIVDKELIKSWLNSQGFIRKANVNEDDYGKVSAIVYLLPDTNPQEIKERLDAVINKI